MSASGRTSRILHENYGSNGHLKSQIQIVDNTKAPLAGPDEVLIPKHLAVLGGLGLTAIAIIFTAAMAVVVAAPRPGFYNESCDRRSCLSDLNLKCINKTCLCTSDQYYTNKCVDKKTYMENCGSLTSHCKNNTNLVCRDGVCKCLDTNYWNGKACVSKSSYNQYCSNDNQCYTDTMAYCDLTRAKCSCPSNRFWDGSACPLLRTFNEACKGDSYCNNTKSLICLNQTCTCNITQYWDSFLLKCLTRQKINETCLTPYQCYLNMSCVNNICTCGAFKYHDIAALTCFPQRIINETCTVNFNCRGDKGLICKDGFCQCEFTGYKWSIERDRCILPKNYTEMTCTYDSDCYVEKGLLCNIGSSCNCPTTSTAGMCDCIRNNSLEYFWDGVSCQQALTYGNNCTSSSSTYMCKWMQEGTVCNASSSSVYTCECPSLMYFDASNNLCKNQTTYDTNCTLNKACRNDLGLTCQNGKCLCNSTTQFWLTTTNKCTNYYKYSNNTCTDDYQCESTLICNNSTNTKCNCPLSLSSGTCDCYRAYGNESYWNNIVCTAALSHGTNCSANYMCKTLTEGTICNGTTGNYTCQCPYLMYFDPASSTCKTQTSYNTNCTTYLACRNDLGLSCQSGKCLCNSTSQFWHSVLGKCYDYYKYTNGTCLADSECASSLICNNSTNTKCNCPVSLSSGTCDCYRAYGNESYWNDIVCTSALSHGYNCTVNYMCKTITEGTICNGTSGNFTCQCPYLMYFDPSSSTCKTQTSYNTNCTTYLACRSDLGLSCQSSKCLCNSTSQFWHVTSNKCIDYYKYTNGTCTADSQCASSLICNNSTNSKCSCPVVLVSGNCDCAREYGNEYFWNDIVCTPALSHGNNCSVNYMCKTLTEGTICNGTSGNYTCQCPYLMYFDPTSSTCKSQTSYNTNCTTYLACRNDLGLSCQSSKCLCNSTSQFWHVTSNKCIDYYKYTNGTCTADSECASSLICNNSTNTKCNCPVALSSDTCDCYRAYGNEFFWNDVQCTTALGHGNNCSANYMCKTLTEGTICNGTTGNYTCQCPYLMYFNPTTSVCLSQTSYNTNCTTYLACRSDLGLSCQSGKCLCNSTAQFWSTSSSMCINYYKYGESGCTSDSHCEATLICNNSTNTKCNCPLSLSANRCDCLREIGNEKYWNGIACVSAQSYNQSCTNGSTSYMCQTLTQKTFCDNTTKTCICGTGGGLSSVTNQCTYCGPGWSFFNGKCYYFSTTAAASSDTGFNISTVFTACNNNASATYALIKDSQTLAFIQSKISSGTYWVGAKYKQVSCCGTTNCILTSDFFSDDRSWYLNSTLVSWCTGHPKDKTSGTCYNCAAYDRTNNCLMSDVCTNTKTVICEVS